MAAKNVFGSIRKATIGGVAFNASTDCNLTFPVSEWETTSVPTSGASVRKMVRRSVNVEGLVLITNTDDLVLLKALAESLDNVTLAVTNAAGDTMRSEGAINIENHETEEGRTTVHLLPVVAWTSSVGEVS
jgi:hypothetical protein